MAQQKRLRSRGLSSRLPSRRPIRRRLELEHLEDRTLLSATGLMAVPLAVASAQAPANTALPPNAVAIDWHGQSTYALKDQWVLRFSGISGTDKQQVQAVQDKLVHAGLGSVHVTDFLGMDTIVLVQAPDQIGYQNLLTSLHGVSGFQYVEPYFLSTFMATGHGLPAVDDPLTSNGNLSSMGTPPAAHNPTPGPLAATINTNVSGLGSVDDPRYQPPDTDLAAGPTYVVETVNATIAFTNKATGNKDSVQTLQQFFASINPGSDIFDPVVTYDEYLQKFVVAALDINTGAQTSYLDLAISTDSNPMDGFGEMHQVNIVQNFGGANAWGDYP
ncbi:MAG: hypothetical protein ACRDQZ_08090, partial [Mycobacteriales bacterium]